MIIIPYDHMVYDYHIGFHWEKQGKCWFLGISSRIEPRKWLVVHQVRNGIIH